MAITVSQYNHTAEILLEESLRDQAGNVKMILLTSGAGYLATHTTASQVTNDNAYNAGASGWDFGGMPLENFRVEPWSMNGAMIDADDIIVTAAGGAIVARAAVIVVDVGGTGANVIPLWHIDFGEEVVATDGSDFQVIFNSNGLCRAQFI